MSLAHGTAHRWRTLAAILIALALAISLAARTGPAAAADGPQDPHGKPEACGACHTTATGGPVRSEADTCLTCHPAGDPHPANQLPKRVHVPAGWPLLDGRVTCATCHADPSCAPDRDRDAPYLRGGNVSRAIQFCDRCHNDGALGRVDPHHPRHASDNADPTCAACHSGIPAKGASPEASRLRADPVDACMTCHTRDVHAGATEHLGEAVDATVTTPLPLAAGRVIACWTCHDVHGDAPSAGSTRRRAAADGIRALALQAPPALPVATTEGTPVLAGAGPSTTGPSSTGVTHPPLLALPSADGSLCRSCHGDGP